MLFTMRSGSNAATSVTKSHSPLSATEPMISRAARSTSSLIISSDLAAKPRDTIRLSRACSGLSMSINDPR